MEFELLSSVILFFLTCPLICSNDHTTIFRHFLSLFILYSLKLKGEKLPCLINHYPILNPNEGRNATDEDSFHSCIDIFDNSLHLLNNAK